MKVAADTRMIIVIFLGRGNIDGGRGFFRKFLASAAMFLGVSSWAVGSAMAENAGKR
jgi:hypothetical protein